MVDLVLPGRGSARFNFRTQCFETLGGASIPIERVPEGRTMSAMELIALIGFVEAREREVEENHG